MIDMIFKLQFVQECLCSDFSQKRDHLILSVVSSDGEWIMVHAITNGFLGLFYVVEWWSSEMTIGQK